MILNNLTKTIVLLEKSFPRSTLNSLCSIRMIFDHKRDQREGATQYKHGKYIKPKNVEVQFKDKFIILEEGSKMENNLVIIFKFFGKSFS